MTWLPCVAIHFEIREVIGQRMEHGVTEELDQKLLALRERQRRIERAGWFS